MSYPLYRIYTKHNELQNTTYERSCNLHSNLKQRKTSRPSLGRTPLWKSTNFSMFKIAVQVTRYFVCCVLQFIYHFLHLQNKRINLQSMIEFEKFIRQLSEEKWINIKDFNTRFVVVSEDLTEFFFLKIKRQNRKKWFLHRFWYNH